jgi:hypothetical protein
VRFETSRCTPRNLDALRCFNALLETSERSETLYELLEAFSGRHFNPLNFLQKLYPAASSASRLSRSASRSRCPLIRLDAPRETVPMGSMSRGLKRKKAPHRFQSRGITHFFLLFVATHHQTMSRGECYRVANSHRTETEKTHRSLPNVPVVTSILWEGL